MELTLTEAATVVGITKQGLLKAIRDGRLSGEKDANGIWKVDTSELFRVYKPATEKAETASNEYEPGHSHVAELVARLEAAADVRRLLEDRLARAERDLDAANARVDQLLKALPMGAPQPVPVVPVVEAPEPTAEPVQAHPRASERPLVASQPEEWIEVPDEPQKPKKRGFLARWFGSNQDD